MSVLKGPGGGEISFVPPYKIPPRRTQLPGCRYIFFSLNALTLFDSVFVYLFSHTFLCVLVRLGYREGRNGQCETCLGCGPQETYVNCADIQVSRPSPYCCTEF